MSTILKALKRLEEDQPKDSRSDAASAAGSASDVSRMPSSSRASDPLRDRLLAEEALAEATAAGAAEERRVMTPLFAGRGPLLAASAAALVLLFGAIGYSISGLRSDVASDPASAAPPPSVARSNPSGSAGLSGSAPPIAMAIPAATTDFSDASRASALPASPPPATTRPPTRPMQATASVAAAASSGAVVRPTRSAAATDPLPANDVRRPIDPSDDVTTHRSQPESRTAAAASKRDASRSSASRPRPTPSPPTRARPPAVAAARPPRPPPSAPSAGRPPVERGQTRVAEGRSASTARPSTSRPSTATSAASPTRPPNSRSAKTAKATPQRVERVERPSLPNISVVRTAWHPQPDRRSARIRLEGSDDIQVLKEGDAIGRLILKEITPSAVLFSAGDVEIRRRVGEGRNGPR